MRQVIGMFLVGLGITVHDGRVRPPYGLRALSQLMLNDRLTQFDAVLKEVQDSRDQSDCILPHYEKDWWSRFSMATTVVLDHEEIVNAWRAQYSTLPTPVCVSRSALLSISALPDTDIIEAATAGTDASNFIQHEIDRNSNHLKEVSETLSKLQVLRRRLRHLEEQRHGAEMNAFVEGSTEGST